MKVLKIKITKRRIGIAITVVALLAIVIITLKNNGVKTAKDIFTLTEALENTYYVTQIVSAVFVVIGAFIAVWQYVLSSRSEIAKYDNEKIERAIELAEYYREHILKKYKFLDKVFDESKIKKIITKIKIDDMNNFDKNELSSLLSEADIDEIKKILNSKEFVEIILKNIRERGTDLGNEKVKKIVEKREYDPNYVLNEDEVKSIKITFMNTSVMEILNRMEYMAMSFTHNIANETVVYSSLSHSYLQIVRILYYNIAINNEGSKRLFLNVTELFKIWRAKANEVKKEVTKTHINSIGIGDIAKKIID